jgi:hypothetical protein
MVCKLPCAKLARLILKLNKMQEILDSEPKLSKIYNDKAVWIGTFIGGPLVAGYLIAANFKVFNQPILASKAWVYSIIITVFIFGGLSVLPNVDKIPQYVIPIVYTTLAYWYVKHLQGANIKAYIETGGQPFSIWRAIIIGLLGAIIMISFMIAISLFAPV